MRSYQVDGRGSCPGVAEAACRELPRARECSSGLVHMMVRHTSASMALHHVFHDSKETQRRLDIASSNAGEQSNEQCMVLTACFHIYPRTIISLFLVLMILLYVYTSYDIIVAL